MKLQVIIGLDFMSKQCILKIKQFTCNLNMFHFSTIIIILYQNHPIFWTSHHRSRSLDTPDFSPPFPFRPTVARSHDSSKLTSTTLATILISSMCRRCWSEHHYSASPSAVRVLVGSGERDGPPPSFSTSLPLFN